jgi:deoxyribonuclease-4
MPLFGAHMSVAGGLHHAVEAAVEHECGTLQIFSKNANQWAAKPLQEDDITVFRQAVKKARLKFVTAHDSYLINLAAPDNALYRKSIAAFTEEIERAEALGLSYLVTHPGAHTGSGIDTGLNRIVAALDEVHKRCAGFKVKVLLENTAGQGSTLGVNFEEIASILDRVKERKRLGVCLDTCHLFAAGYEIHTPGGHEAAFDEFADRVGLAALKLFHLNDSAKPLGSRVDRHAGLGLGHIGLNAFRRIVNDSRFHKLPMILETPKEDDAGKPMDPVNLGILRRLTSAKHSKS